MKITYKNVITVLKVLTTASFIIALGFKLYNIYKYGGPKKPDKPIEKDDDDDMESPYPDQPMGYAAVEETEAYDSVGYDEPKSYSKN